MKDRTLLVVEDEEDDVFLLRRALKEAGFAPSLQVIRDGEAALAYLRGEGKYGDRSQYPMPDLVLLDLKLPYVHGFEVLGHIRSSPALQALPVAILTSSLHHQDRERAVALGVEAFLIKPPTAEMLRGVMGGFVTT